MLHTNRQTYCRRSDMLLFQFLGSHLGMGCRSRMNDQRFDIGNISEQRKYFQGINKPPCVFMRTIDFKSKNRATAIGEILFIQLMIVVRNQRRVRHTLYFGVLGQEVNHLESILYMTLYTQW